MAYQVFISYRRSGGDAMAFILNERLSAEGIKVFYDVNSLSSGKFGEKIFEIMDVCNDVIVILSPDCLNDRIFDEEDWIRQEVTHAITTGKNVIPIMMNGFEWSQELPDAMQELPKFNGITASFMFFDGFYNKLKSLMVTNNNSSNITVKNESNVSHMLFWSDFDPPILNKIINKLELEENVYSEILVEPSEILSKNLQEIECIVFIDTDVTKFSNNDLAIERINEALVNYVDAGGKLIVTHDAIYRRTRNHILENMFGYKISYFEQKPEGVKYIKSENCEDTNRFMSLPEEFVLQDAEICWGMDPAGDIDVYFETEDGKPLVFSREYGNGICIWLNPGDYKNYPPRSISKPEKNFIALLKEAISLKY